MGGLLPGLWMTMLKRKEQPGLRRREETEVLGQKGKDTNSVAAGLDLSKGKKGRSLSYHMDKAGIEPASRMIPTGLRNVRTVRGLGTPVCYHCTTCPRYHVYIPSLSESELHEGVASKPKKHQA